MPKETKVKETKQFKEEYELDHNALSYLHVNQVLSGKEYSNEAQEIIAATFCSFWNSIKKNSTLEYFFDEMLDCWQLVKYNISNSSNSSNSLNPDN